MSGFSGNTDVEVFDTLTVVVMIEQCEPELTVVTWWDCGSGYKFSQLLKHTACLACLLQSVALSRADDGRGTLLAMVKSGQVQVESIKPIVSDVWRCPRCRAHLKDIPNESWLVNLQS